MNHGVRDIKTEDLRGAHLQGADLRGLDLHGRDLEAARLNGASLSGANLRGANLRGAQLQGADLAVTNLSGANLTCVNLSEADLVGSDLNGANLTNANLTKADLLGATLQGSNLTDARFSHAHLFQADLRGATISHATCFEGVTVRLTHVDRYCAAFIKPHIENLRTDSLIVADDIAVLRREFGGFWGAVHLLFILTFFAPYLLFLGSLLLKSHSLEVSGRVLQSAERWAEASQINTTTRASEKFKNAVLGGIEKTAEEWRTEFGIRNHPELPVGLALGRYIVNGGKYWKTGWFPNYSSITCFLVVVIYNGLRLSLLWKTKKLEAAEAVSELPVQFSFHAQTYWHKVYLWTCRTFWFALGAIVINSFTFLGTPILV